MHSHVLNIESCRYFNIVRNERICTMCNKRAIEDEYHFILECDRYNVNDIWETWKYIVNTAAESVARKVPKVKNYKTFWIKV